MIEAPEWFAMRLKARGRQASIKSLKLLEISLLRGDEGPVRAAPFSLTPLKSPC